MTRTAASRKYGTRADWVSVLLAVLVAGAALAAATGPATTPLTAKSLRVCSDPSNMPLSNSAGEGYENKIAEALAHDLNRPIEYTYFPQRMGFVRRTLRAKDDVTGQWKCDLIIGVPSGYDLTDTTSPYLHSTYALVLRKRPEFSAITTPDDLLRLPAEKRQALKIGAFQKSPAADWLLRGGMIDQGVWYAAQSGDPEEFPGKIIERDLLAKKLDGAVVWGPIAGYLVQRHPEEWSSVPFAHDPAIRFDFEISMGLRNGEKEWKAVLDRWIASHHQQINSIMTGYHIPLLDAEGRPISASGQTTQEFRQARR
jgi:quinoprotein dehydrogenase-associated probable ABC transporter substrate-binding protein